MRRHDTAVFHLKIDVFPADFVVYMLGFGSRYEQIPKWGDCRLTLVDALHNRGGLWLLRPAGDDEFSLISCLSRLPMGHNSLYDHWSWTPDYSREHSPKPSFPLRRSADFSRSHIPTTNHRVRTRGTSSPQETKTQLGPEPSLQFSFSKP